MSADSLLDTSAATSIVVTVHDVPPDMTTPELVRLMEAVEFVLDFSASITRQGMRDIYRAPAPHRGEAFRESIRIHKLNYGSPLRMSFDLQPIEDYLSRAGKMVFLELVRHILVDDPIGWDRLRGALEIHAKNNSLKALTNRARSRRRRVPIEPSARDLERLAAEEREKFQEALEPIVNEILTEDASQKERMGAQRVLETSAEYLKHYAHLASRSEIALRGRSVYITIE